MSQLPSRPPIVNDDTRPFWDATAGGRIHLPRCETCDLVIWYPRHHCPDCQGDVTWVDVSGRGTIYSYTIVRRGASGSWREHPNYVIAYVELEEGPRLLTNIVEADPDALGVGDRVEVVFDDTGEGNSLLRFRPAKA
jgi:uncharacterized OB-fold protein